MYHFLSAGGNRSLICRLAQFPTDAKIMNMLLAEKINEQGLSFREGAKQFGVPVWRLYELNRLQRSAGIGTGFDDREAVLPVEIVRNADGGCTSRANGKCVLLSTFIAQFSPTRYYLSKLLLKRRTPEISLLDLACKLFPAGFIAENIDQHIPYFYHYPGITSVFFTVCIAVQIAKAGKIVFENFFAVASASSVLVQRELEFSFV